MTAFNPAQFETGLQALSGFDFGAALAAFRAGDVRGEIATAEQAVKVINKVVPIPGFMEIEAGLMVLGFIALAYQRGWVKSAAVEDPAMARVERDRGGR